MKFENENGSFKRALADLGIVTGDILYISSDIKTLLFNITTKYGFCKKTDTNKALHELIDTFKDIVGNEGTLLFPVFSWAWCRGKGFNIKTTKGEVGTLQNWVLENREDFKRTRHPIYSFMVWGNDMEYLLSMDNQDAWSHTSPFYYLQTHGAKQLLFNIESYQGLTFGHYIEQDVGVPYRHPKYFFGNYTDENGITEKRMYSMYVRDIDVEAECGIHNDWLIENSVAKRVLWEGNTLTIVDLQKSYLIIKNDMLNNNGKNTLKFATGNLDWNAKQRVPYEIKGIDE